MSRSGILLLLLALLGSVAQATRIEISTRGESRLELRNVVLPDGSEVELIVILGQPVEIRLDEQLLIAEHVEIDQTNRLVRVIGFGIIESESETLQGEGLILELEDEAFSGEDVLIVTEAIDVYGEAARRIPGQISVLGAAFSPCSRCQQPVEDYGFRAQRLELYPGDRLVAYDVTFLIRGQGTFGFPILVLPLAPADKRPQLRFQSGTAEDRAEVALDWPYVAGANAYGTFSVRYYADVRPGEGNFLSENLLGGAVETDYLGGGFEHRFFTETGSGEAVFFYVPSFLDRENPGTRDPAEFTARIAYTTAEDVRVPALDVLVELEDARRERLVEYRWSVANTSEGISGRVSSQGFVDLDPDDLLDPSYLDRTTPRFTVARLQLSADEPLLPFSLGPLTLRELELDLGAFEDLSNPTNRSAAATRLQTAARLLEGHTIVLDGLELWSGFELSGETRFRGQYYTTAERLVDWDTRIQARQRFGSSSFGVAFTRDVSEGETPFRFDQLPLRNRTDLRADLTLEPLPWLSLTTSGGRVLEDTRNPGAVGWLPLETTLTLFRNLREIDLSLRNSYDLEGEDPGNLTGELTFTTPGSSVRGNLRVTHTQDLEVAPDRITGEPVDETETQVAASIEFPASVAISLEGGYRYAPPDPEDPAEPRAYWAPLELGVTLGTLQQDDALPGLRLVYARDLNAGKLDALEYQAAFRLGPLEFGSEQRFDVPNERLSSSRHSVTWPGVVLLEVTGFPLIPPAWVGLEPETESSQRWTVTLRDAPSRGEASWQLRLQTDRAPGLRAGGQPGFRNTALEARVLLEARELGPLRFSVDFFSDLKLSDDVQPGPYLQRANLELGADLFERIGLQGTLSYRGVYSLQQEEVTQGTLTFDDVALTVRATDDLYLGALLDDVWTVIGEGEPINLQPTFYLVWDRCCWALYASWDSATGQIRFAITAPGAGEGLIQTFDTELRLPGGE